MIRPRTKSILRGIVTVIAVLTFYTVPLLAQTPDSGSGAEDSSSTQEQTISTADIWAPLVNWDTGYDSSVALHSSGLFVEVHSSSDYVGSNKGLFYRLGQIDPSTGKVTRASQAYLFAPGQLFFHPSVAITKEGYVVVVNTTSGQKIDGRMAYWVGTLDPYGGVNQQINLKVLNQYYDTGWRPTISINYNGIIAEAHEGDSSQKLYYRLGHLNSPGTGDFTIAWDTGSGGTSYDTGLAPVISLNDNGDVVEVHRSQNQQTVHYTRGKLSGNTIAFSTTHPYLDHPAQSALVVVLNNRYVMEINAHITKDPITGDSIRFLVTYQLGSLDANNPNIINWISKSAPIENTPLRGGLASNGINAVATTNYGGIIKITTAIAP